MLQHNVWKFAIKIIVSCLTLIVIFAIVGLMTTAKPAHRMTTVFFSNWTSTFDQSIFSFLYSIEQTPYRLLMENSKQYKDYVNYTLFPFTSLQLTNVNSLIGKELPGFATYEQRVIIASEQSDDLASLFHESGPPLEDILAERDAIDDSETAEREPDGEFLDEKVVFLYSSHNRESFLPHLPKETKPDRAYHKEVNITKVSDRLAHSLEKSGIGAAVDKTDITTLLHEKGWTYGKSYEASRPVVQTAMKQHDNIEYIFDIHRDSLPYEKTTKTIDDIAYATLLFVIGAENSDYEKNLTLATTLHTLLEEKLPGISRGVITKEGPGSNGVYNQDVTENALLIEVGGYDNHLEEMYRTIDIFAEVFADYYLAAEKVSK